MPDENLQPNTETQRHRGRLELTWTNKDDRLVSREDGSYEWVPASDYRVAEVHLLHDAGTVGEDPASNLLIRGDALHALTSLTELAEYEDRCLGKVKLAYLDPPFNTQQSFLQYDDALEHSVWLTMMRDRLEQVKRLLAPDGSVWVHCDDSEQAYLKVVMDELFGRENYVATVIWEKTDSPRMDAAYFSVRHDYILVYRASDEFTLNPLNVDGEDSHHNRLDEEGRRYYLNPLRARGQGAKREDRPNLYFGIKAPNGRRVYPKLPNGGDGRWRWSKDRVETDAHLVEWVKGRGGWNPYYRIYEPDQRTRPPETIWSHTDVGSTRTSAKEIKDLFSGGTFATPKPEKLLARIIEVGSEPGDLVLDCFLGSGTTAAVAHKLNRRWIGIEWSRDTVTNFAIPRLERVVAGRDDGGVSEAVEWQGGGGFQILDVGGSMFESDDGEVVLAEWATNGKLADATAAQLHFALDDDPPFCGRKGNHRLAVIDGLVSEDVVDLLASRLDESEQLTVCGTSVDPNAIARLKELRPGSRVKKIPASLLADYQQTRRWKARRSNGKKATSKGRPKKVESPA